MTWHYRAIKKIDDDGSHFYYVVEYYPYINAHTASNYHFCEDSPEELVQSLRNAADDIEKYGVLDEN